MDVSRRTGTSAQTGETWGRTNVVVFGSQGVVAEVTFRDGAEGTPPEAGATVKMLVEVGTYRDDDRIDFVRYLK